MTFSRISIEHNTLFHCLTLHSAELKEILRKPPPSQQHCFMRIRKSGFAKVVIFDLQNYIFKCFFPQKKVLHALK